MVDLDLTVRVDPVLRRERALADEGLDDRRLAADPSFDGLAARARLLHDEGIGLILAEDLAIGRRDDDDGSLLHPDLVDAALALDRRTTRVVLPVLHELV